MEFDEALRFAVILAWEDLLKVTDPCSARVEYQCEPGATLDQLQVWSDRGRGYLDLVCEYSTGASSAHPREIRFANRHHSNQLTAALDFIMDNPGQFKRPADACRHGFVLVYPPNGDDRTEAAVWIRGLHGIAADSGAGDARPSHSSTVVHRLPPGSPFTSL